MMMGSLFFSRALLSVGLFLFFAVSFFHPAIKKQVSLYFSTPLLWGMSLLFFMPLLSGFWSEDKQAWYGIMQIKLPLLLLPLAFAAPFSFSKKQWDVLCYFFILLVTLGTIWSMLQYLPIAAQVHEDYLKAKTIITPLGNDHVRFSWLVSIAALLSAWVMVQKIKQRSLAIILCCVLLWLIIFLHILAVRTGLFSFYIMLLITAAWLALRQIRRKYAVVILLFIILLPVTAYFTLPTFQNRMKYIRYDFGYFKKAHYLPGSNDAVRIISYRAGLNILMNHPVIGSGFGDILSESRNYYASEYPQMQENEKIYPSSEWVMYGAGCGLPGILVFLGVMLIPFLIRVNERRPWWLLTITAAFSLLFDIGLEVQFGVFAYAFIILWWWKWLNDESSRKNI
jgi:O-antigen ligase